MSSENRNIKKVQFLYLYKDVIYNFFRRLSTKIFILNLNKVTFLI